MPAGKYPNIIKKKIDEWIYLIKNDEIKEGATAKNIDKAAEKLAFLNMSEVDRKRYERYLINLHREKNILDTAKEEGLKEGREEGFEEGREEGQQKEKIKAACKMKKDGMPIDLIAKYTGRSEAEVSALNC